MHDARTVMLTPSGEVEVKELPDTGMRATSLSRFAPQWLVFPNHIINTSNITSITRRADKPCEIIVSTIDKQCHVIELTTPDSANLAFFSMQKMFGDGIPG